MASFYFLLDIRSTLSEQAPSTKPFANPAQPSPAQPSPAPSPSYHFKWPKLSKSERFSPEKVIGKLAKGGGGERRKKGEKKKKKVGLLTTTSLPPGQAITRQTPPNKSSLRAFGGVTNAKAAQGGRGGEGGNFVLRWMPGVPFCRRFFR